MLQKIYNHGIKFWKKYLPVKAPLTAPEVSEEEGSYASRFYRWILKSFKSFSSCGSARFNRHSCTVASLKVSAMIANDVAAKVLDTKSFRQHNIEHCWPDLWHYIYFLVQSGEAFMMEGNTHTHTRARRGSMETKSAYYCTYRWISRMQYPLSHRQFL